jgi:hypothetical protein
LSGVLASCVGDSGSVSNFGGEETILSTYTDRPFPADNPWNQDISKEPVDPNSDIYINSLGRTATMHPDFGTWWDGAPNGQPFIVVTGKQKKVPVTFEYARESDPGPYPIPADAPIQGGPNGSGDRHVIVVDKDNNLLYELYRAFPDVRGGWNAVSGAVFDLSSNKTKVKDFLKENHIQGNTPFEKCFGLVYNDEIISVMTFGHKRGCRGGKQTNGNEWELSRFCNKMNTVVIGGAGKLLKHFEKMVNPEIIYSYSSNDISNGNLYKKLDFKEDSISIPYWYVEPKTLNRYHRTSFTKREITRKGMTSDTKFTESEVMKKYNFLKIYDSGMTKWVKHL